MFGYPQSEFLSTTPMMNKSSSNPLQNNFPWFHSGNSKYNDLSNQIFGTGVRFEPCVQTGEKCRFQSLVLMPEYQDKSLEELRLEDYMANRQHSTQVRSNGFGCLDFAKNEMPLFNTLLGSKTINFADLFFSSTGAQNRPDDTIFKRNEMPIFTNTSFLLEQLLNHIKHRLNVHLISDETRATCERLTTQLIEFTEQTLETLAVVVLEDMVKNIKGNARPIFGSPFPHSKADDADPDADADDAGVDAAGAPPPAPKVSPKADPKNGSYAAAGVGGGGYSRSAGRAAPQPPTPPAPSKRGDARANSEEAAAGADFGADEGRTCRVAAAAAAIRCRSSPRKRRDRARCAECRCDAGKRSCAGGGCGCSASLAGKSGVCSRAAVCAESRGRHEHRGCGSGCGGAAGGRRAPSKSSPRGRRGASKQISFADEDEPDRGHGGRRSGGADERCVCQRLQSINVSDADELQPENDGETEGTAYEDGDKLKVRYVSPSNSPTLLSDGNDPNNDVKNVTRSLSDESDFSSV